MRIKRILISFLIYLFTQISVLSSDLPFSDTVTPFCEGKNKDFFLNNVHDFPNDISIEIKNKNKWKKNLLKLFAYQKLLASNKIENFGNPSSPLMLREFFKADIIVTFKDNIKCNFDGLVRLHGSTLSDHMLKNIDFKNLKTEEINDIFPSLRVKLNNGHVNNSNDFSILTLESRKNENEIVSSVLFREIGVIVPELFKITASLNGIEQKRLFLDRNVENILTFNKKRPGPYIATNRRQSFKNITLSRARQINKNFKDVVLQDYMRAIDWHNYILINNLKTENFRKILNDNENKIFKQYIQLAYATENFHALDYGDFRNYYNVYYDEFEPIFYEGSGTLYSNIDLMNANDKHSFKKKINVNKDFHFYYLTQSTSELKDSIKKINLISFKNKLQKRGVTFNEKKLKKYFDVIFHNINFVNKLENINKTDDNRIINFKKDIFRFNEHFELVFFIKENLFEICDVSMIYCRKTKLSNKEIDQLLSNQIAKIKNSTLRFVRKSKNDYLKNEINPKKKLQFKHFKINLKNDILIYYKDAKIFYDESKMILYFESKNNESKVFIRNSTISDLEINTNSCLMIENSLLKNVSIISTLKTNKCNNHVHIVNSKGHINKIISTSNNYGDNIDFDLSELNIELIKVNSSTQDCLGIKNGIYKFSKIFLKDCSDKSFSVGDKSIADVKEIFIENTDKPRHSKAEIVVKNSSVANIKNTTIKTKNLCAAAYRKNNAYSGSKIIFNKKYFICPTSVYEHKDSKILLK